LNGSICEKKGVNKIRNGINQATSVACQYEWRIVGY